jgi:Ca2+-binding RTX toxin-like protein
MKPWRGSSPALAATILSSEPTRTTASRGGEDYLEGSGGNDYLNGGGGDDTIEGRGGNDEIIPGEGDDVVFAGAGNDLIYARDTDEVDIINCGGGFDKVETIHRDDRTKSNCERALSPRQGDI